MPTDTQAIDRLAREIADYLSQNTQAADDVRGIMRWWLRYEGGGKTCENVQAALELLEEQGLVMRSALRDGHVIYGRALPGYDESHISDGESTAKGRSSSSSSLQRN